MHYGDMTDSTNLIRIIQETQPNEIYNLAAQSHVQVSFRDAGIYRQCRCSRHAAPARGHPHSGDGRPRPFYQASTSELYGLVQETPQRETTPFYPRSPYAAAKLYAYWITVNYREAYGMHASNGILFNHESPIRGETFVTRKITRAVAAITRAAGQALSRQSRRQARLGPCPRLCRRHVADAAAGQAGRLRAGHRRNPFGARIRRAGLRARSESQIEWRGEGVEERASTPRPAACSSRSMRAISARPRSTCFSAIRPRPAQARLAAQGRFRPARQGDGRRRHARAPSRQRLQRRLIAELRKGNGIDDVHYKMPNVLGHETSTDPRRHLHSRLHPCLRSRERPHQGAGLSAGGVTLNCGYGHGYSVREIVEAVRRVSAALLRQHSDRGGPAIRPPSLPIAGQTACAVWTPARDDIDAIVANALTWKRKLAVQ